MHPDHSQSNGKRHLKRHDAEFSWVDTNKGDDAHPLVRSRLVAMEFRRPGIEKWFAATPPIEALRVLLVIDAAGCPRVKPPENSYTLM